MQDRLGQALGLVGAMLFAMAVPAMAQDVSELTVEESDEHGEYLATEEGRAVYLFESDSGDQSTCYDDCADAWPPVTAEDGTPDAGEGVDEDEIGTIEREDGTEQVTYGGHPLYLFVRDTMAGQTSGHEVEGFGAEWYLVSPGGDKAGSDVDAGDAEPNRGEIGGGADEPARDSDGDVDGDSDVDAGDAEPNRGEVGGDADEPDRDSGDMVDEDEEEDEIEDDTAN